LQSTNARLHTLYTIEVDFAVREVQKTLKNAVAYANYEEGGVLVPVIALVVEINGKVLRRVWYLQQGEKDRIERSEGRKYFLDAVCSFYVSPKSGKTMGKRFFVPITIRPYDLISITPRDIRDKRDFELEETR
jgi:hypothetical protein